MSNVNPNLQHLYQGYLNTPLLWNSNSVFGLHQLQINNKSTFPLKRLIHKRLRLGQLVEQFVFNQLEQTENCNILAENIQIQKNKQTLGELDALIEVDKQSIHLEVVYKFYLYDESLGDFELERWIGPNRKDSLIEKLTKLKNKQLPLLYSPKCKSTLEQLHLNTINFQQQVLFKAQLFVPYKKTVVFEQLNEDCVCGFYLKTNQLDEFSNCSFYIPSKLDWLLEANHYVNWLTIKEFKLQADTFLKQKRSPLVWIKKSDNNLLKCVLVWW